MTRTAIRRLALILALVGAAVLMLGLVGPAAGSPSKQQRKLATITLDTLPIANGFALDIGIAQGFFASAASRSRRPLFQSGNDIVLAMATTTGTSGTSAGCRRSSPVRRGSRW